MIRKNRLRVCQSWLQQQLLRQIEASSSRARESLNVDNASELKRAVAMDSISEIMRALRAGRALAGLSQEEMAELVGVSRQIIVRVEKGDGNVLVEAVEKMRAALEKKGVVFIEGTERHGPAVALTRQAGPLDQ